MTAIQPLLQVDYPRFERLPRDRSAKADNEAVVHATAGLVAMLETSLCERAGAVGAGYQAPLTVPFGLAVTAAIGALGEPDPFQERWMVRSAVIEWEADARGNDAISAYATVERVGDRDAVVAARARGSATGSLLRASIRLLPMHRGRYAAIATSGLAPSPVHPAACPNAAECSSQTVDAGAGTSEYPRAPLLALRPPRVLASGERIEVAFEPDLLRLLTHPVAGHAEPLGRRVHPLGGAPLGAALTAALVAAGERESARSKRTRILRADATWLLPLSTNVGWIARTRGNARNGATTTVVDVIDAGTRTALTASIEWTVG